MKKFLTYFSIAAVSMLAVGFVAAFSISAFSKPSSAHASTFALPSPSIAVNSYPSNASYDLFLPQAGPFTQDFKIEMCLYPPDYNGWGPVCFTSPWASQMNTGQWTVAARTPQGAGGTPITYNNTGNWSAWGYPGHADELVTENGVATANITVIPGAALPSGEYITDLVLGMQLSEDDNGSATDGTTLYSTNPSADPGSVGPVFTGGLGLPNGDSGSAWGFRASNGSYSFTPDSARMYMSDSVQNAQAVSNNVPTTFTTSQTQTNGTNGQPIEITLQNTGTTAWQSYIASVIQSSETGTCDDPVAACPDPSYEPVGSQCTAQTNDFSYPFELQHTSGSFTVGSDPVRFTMIGTQTCSVVMGCNNPFSGDAICQQDQSDCESLSPGGCADPDYTDAVSCGMHGFSWTDPICGGTWEPQLTQTNANASVSPGQNGTFSLSSLTAPSTPGTYTETWQMLDPRNNQYESSHNFGDVISIPITVNSGGTTVTVTANPSTITSGSPSQCSAVVDNGSGNQSVTWTATGPATIDPASGLLTSTGSGTATCIATPVVDPNSPGSASITINPPAGGTVTVDSVNAVNQSPLQASWNWPAPPSGATVSDQNCQTDHTDNNQPAGNYTLNPVSPCTTGSFALNSIESKPIAFNGQKPLSERLVSLVNNMLASVANASQVSPAPSLTLPPSGNITFLILWAPIADMSVSPSNASLSGTAGGSAVSTNVTVENDGIAPGSQLTWTSSVNGATWLSVSPSSDSSGLGNGSSDSVTITADPSGLAASTTPYTGTITFNGTSVQDGSSIIKNVTVSFNVGSGNGGGTSGYDCINNACSPVPSNATYSSLSSCNASCGVPPPPQTCGGANNPCGACTFTANPTSVIVPQQSTLTTSCTDVTGCQITGGNINGSIPISADSSNDINGNTTKVSPTGNTTYTLTCSGSNGGTVTETTQVNVGNSTLCESNPNGVNCPHP